MMRPYLVEDKDIINAYINALEQNKEFNQKCIEFAKTYDAKPYLTGYHKDIMFDGLIFERGANVDYEVWTKPHSNIRHSRIRTSFAKVSIREKAVGVKIEYTRRLNEYLGEYLNDNGYPVTSKNKLFFEKLGIRENTLIGYNFKLIENNERMLMCLDYTPDEVMSFAKEIYVSEYEKLLYKK